jgi:hypothetical protein
MHRCTLLSTLAMSDEKPTPAVTTQPQTLPKQRKTLDRHQRVECHQIGEGGRGTTRTECRTLTKLEQIHISSQGGASSQFGHKPHL